MVCFFISLQITSQKNIEINKEKLESKHSLNLELIGRTFVFSSINYEYSLHEKITLGTGLGVLYVESRDITRDNNGLAENGRYFDITLSQMIYANYFIGKNKHKVFFTAGLSNFSSFNRNKYPSETQFSNENTFSWNTGIGYQYNKEKIYFRLTGYLLRIRAFSESLGIDFLPWGGTTIGYRF